MRGTFAYLFLPCCPMKDIPSQSYRQACLRLLFSLLVIWFIVSFGCGILFREWLDANAPKIGSAPFGFWMAQQGAIICFVILLVVYAVLMNRLDTKQGYTED